jgi:hypothetical protein
VSLLSAADLDGCLLDAATFLIEDEGRALEAALVLIAAVALE